MNLLVGIILWLEVNILLIQCFTGSTQLLSNFIFKAFVLPNVDLFEWIRSLLNECAFCAFSLLYTK